MAAAEPILRPRLVGLPFHRAAIVDLALLPPLPGQGWRLATADAEGWVRVWVDGALETAELAHPGGVSALRLSPEGTLFTAGFDGRVLAWRDSGTAGEDEPGGGLEPDRAWVLAVPSSKPQTPGSATVTTRAPVTALAVGSDAIAISDGQLVQLWSREPDPTLRWSRRAAHFVTGLTLSEGGGVVAAAELRAQALDDALANHPLAPFTQTGAYAPSEAEQAALRASAERDFPGARADFVEVWQPRRRRHRDLHPRGPIDSDIAILDRGVVAYREIWDPAQAWVIAIRLEDIAHIWVPLFKPAPFLSVDDPAPGLAPDLGVGADGYARAGAPVGDFVVNDAGGLVIIDHFDDWAAAPPEHGWWVGGERELAVGQGYAALGDAQGNLAVAALSDETHLGWRAPGEEIPMLLGASPNGPHLVTATLEPRSRYRVFDLDAGVHRLLRVEAPSQAMPPSTAGVDGQEAPGRPVPRTLFPISVAIDDRAQTVVASLSSFSAESHAGIRTLPLPGGAPRLTLDRPTPTGFAVALDPAGRELAAWSAGDYGFYWRELLQGPSTDGPRGAPLFSADGRWIAFVSAQSRQIAARPDPALSPAPALAVHRVENTGVPEFSEAISALADDGTLAVVQPFGGGLLEWIPADPDIPLARIELPGAGTALAWVGQSLVIGFEDGSIARLDLAPGASPDTLDAAALQIVDPGRGGRVWALAGLSRAGAQVFAELDESGLSLHRLDDRATLALHIADSSALSRHADSSPQPARAGDLVAIWWPGAGLPPCRILDGSRAGVLAGPEVERWGPERATEMFAAFFSGASCGELPPEAPPDVPEPGEPSPAPGEPGPKPEPADPGA